MQINLTVEGPSRLPLDFTPAIKRIRMELLKDIRDNFQGSHAPDGTPWKPLAMNRPRNRGKGNPKPLLDKGLLRNSITTAGPGHVEMSGPLFLEVGTELDYAWIHQAGGKIRPKTAKYLALPLSREAVSYPRPRFFPRPLFVVKKRRLLLAESVTKRRKPVLVFHYLLLTEVEIPAREFVGFSPTFMQRAEDHVVDFIGEWLGGKY